MIERMKRVLHEAGVAAEVVDELAQRVATPPPGTIDAAELQTANISGLALGAAVVAANSPQDRPIGKTLKPLLAFIGAQQISLSAYDRGRFWHLRGVVASREDGYTAIRPLNRSIALLQDIHTPAAREYRMRVFNTLGQVLEAQGLLGEARQEFEQLLALRQDLGDEDGMARTMGNLGRVCMQLGDFAAAAEYLQRDLAILGRLTPHDHSQRLRLLSQLGTCALEQKDYEAAQRLFEHSVALARTVQDASSLAFATRGLGQVAFQTHRLKEAWARATEALLHLAGVDEALPFYHGLRGLILQLLAQIHSAHQRVTIALDTFQEAVTHFRQAPAVSHVEMAQLLYAFAQAHHLHGTTQQAASLLCEALRELDATSAEALRQQVESALRDNFPGVWSVYTAGRFLGHQHIESVLQEAGRGGFRGASHEVVILFSDIRDFTTLSTHFQAQELIDFLNDYLRHMTRCIEHYQGMVDKFIGDAVMALFTVPAPQPDDALRAVRAALLMRDELDRFNRSMRRASKPPLRMGVGVHTGPVVAGLIGSPQKRSYTVIGDAVNIASRLEGLTKYLGVPIAISDAVITRLPPGHGLLLRRLGRYRLKGRETAVEVAEVMGEEDNSYEARALKAEIVRTQTAVDHLQARRFTIARNDFLTLATAAAQAGDSVRAAGYAYLAGKAAAYLSNPPEPWDGAIHMEDK
jgi:class 3 adenylate cyclase/Tfp pilus assembly protein PilF